jgi:hypothetical protein
VGKTPLPVTCPAAQTSLYVRPLSFGPGIKGLGRGTGTFADINALICRYVFALTGETAMPRPYGHGGALRFRSLRLSVRTPPFHGGESGSIPLGSAIYFSGLAQIPPSISPPHAVSLVLRQSISARRNRRSARIFFDCATGQSFSSGQGHMIGGVPCGMNSLREASSL